MSRRDHHDGSSDGRSPRTAVELSDDLVDRVDRRLAYSEFETVDGYVQFALEEVLARVEEATDENVDAVERAEVESRLEALGYLD